MRQVRIILYFGDNETSTYNFIFRRQGDEYVKFYFLETRKQVCIILYFGDKGICTYNFMSQRQLVPCT